MISKLLIYRPLLSQKQYLKLIAANLISRFGDSLDMIAFSWIMYQITQSAALLALIAALNFLPNILLGPFTGVLADRLPKKRLMVACDLLRGLMVTLTAVGYLFSLLTPVALVCVTLVNSTLETFRQPAGSAIVPLILDREQYTLGISINQSLSRVMELIGMACAGGIIALLGSPVALLIDAVTFVLSAAMICLIRCRETLTKSALSLKSYLSELTDGFRCLKENRFLFCLILLGAFMNFSTAPLNAFQTIYIAESLRLGPGALSFVGVVLTSGMALGSFILPVLQKRWQGKWIFLTAGFFFSACFGLLWALPFLSVQWLLVGLLGGAFFLMGIAVGIQNAIYSVNFTSHIDAAMMGRISAISNALILCMIPLSSFLCSGLAGILPVPAVFLVFAAISAGVYLIATRIKLLAKL